MKKIIAVILIISFLGFVVFAEDQQSEIVTVKYTTEQKTAITIWTIVMSIITTIIVKEVVVDGAYGARD